MQQVLQIFLQAQPAHENYPAIVTFGFDRVGEDCEFHLDEAPLAVRAPIRRMGGRGESELRRIHGPYDRGPVPRPAADDSSPVVLNKRQIGRR